MTPTQQERQALVSQVVFLKATALRLRMYATYKALNEAGNQAGWEHATKLGEEGAPKEKEF